MGEDVNPSYICPKSRSDTVIAIASRTVERAPPPPGIRAAYARSGRLEDVVDLIVKETAEGLS